MLALTNGRVRGDPDAVGSVQMRTGCLEEVSSIQVGSSSNSEMQDVNPAKNSDVSRAGPRELAANHTEMSIEGLLLYSHKTLSTRAEERDRPRSGLRGYILHKGKGNGVQSPGISHHSSAP